MDCLSKEQLLLLQHNLTYEVYEKFMGMFNNSDELLPKNINLRNKYILETMKNHEYWGKIHGWGENRVYIHLPKRKHFVVKDQGPHSVYDMFKGNTKKELLNFLEEFKKYTPSTFTINECIPVTEEELKEEFKGIFICGNCCYAGDLKEENIIMPCINCAERNNWMFKGNPCLGGYPGADHEGNMMDDIEITPEDLAALRYNQNYRKDDGSYMTNEEKMLHLPPHVAEIYKSLYLQ